MIDATTARRRLLLLTGLRWLPVGVVLGVTVLLPLERGLSIAAIGSLLAIQGFVVLALELPTGALSDTAGRRPILVISGVLAVAAGILFLIADSYALFALSLLLQGVFRALDSGSLEAWFVDAMHEQDPHADIARPLAHASGALGSAIAIGALAGGLLVAWHPFAASSALALPVLVAITLYAGYTILTAVLVREPHRPAGRHPWTVAPRAAYDAPRAIADGARLVARSRVLAGLLLVEIFWSAAMIAFETLTPLQLTILVGTERGAAAVFGPASAVAWGLFAVGALLASRASRAIGVTRTAILSRLLGGLVVVVMGLAAGLVGLLIAFHLAYLTHGSAGPMHATLLHREADRSTRATVLSLNSMAAGGAYSIGLIALTSVAESLSVATAIVIAGAFSLLGALCYLPALRRERSSLVRPIAVPDAS
jgi:MFS family permease